MLSSRKRILLLTLIFSLIPVYSNISYSITRIEINGLTRTKDSTVLNIIKLGVGDEISESFIPVIRQNLLKENIFISDMEININPLNDYEAVLELKLQDKWTIIPVPVAVVTSSSYLFGGVFVESNLLGLNHSLVSGLFYSGDNLRGFTAWELPENGLGSFTISGNYSTGEIVYYDFFGNQTTRENYDRFGVKIKYEKEIFYDLYLSLSVKPNVKSQQFHIYSGFGIKFDDEEILPYLKEGSVISLDYENQLFIEESRICNQLKSEMSFSKVFSFIFLQLVINGGYAFDPFYYPFYYGGTNGSRIFKTNSVKVKSYFNSVASFEIKLFDLEWGYITLPLYYESGVLTQPYNDKLLSYNGPGSGVVLYLKKIAFPAFGFNYTYDLMENRYKFSVALGYEI